VDRHFLVGDRHEAVRQVPDPNVDGQDPHYTTY
jgi:hypothetical protein